jgi:hypothetical protein
VDEAFDAADGQDAVFVEGFRLFRNHSTSDAIT